MVKPIYQGRVVTLNVDTVRLPNGHTIDLEVIRHPGASAVVPMKEDGTVVLIRQFRHAANGFIYEIPAGKLHPKEDPLDCAARELEEEIGTHKAAIIAESRDWLSYDLPPELVGKLWGGRYRGQRQKWFVMRFEGEDSDINIATEHPEFCEWKWTPMHTLPDIIVPFKRANYAALVKEFAHLAK